MEKDRKRALRRYHNDRMQKRALKMLEDWHWFWNDPDPIEKYETARRWRDNMCRCSCSGCGNPRNADWSTRRDRMTMPELKAEDSYLDQIADIV